MASELEDEKWHIRKTDWSWKVEEGDKVIHNNLPSSYSPQAVGKVGQKKPGISWLLSFCSFQSLTQTPSTPWCQGINSKTTRIVCFHVLFWNSSFSFLLTRLHEIERYSSYKCSFNSWRSSLNGMTNLHLNEEGKMKLWDPTFVGEENKTHLIRVWKSFPSRRVLKILRENPKVKLKEDNIG